MEDTAITHLSFSREYTAAVEAKQVCHSVIFAMKVDRFRYVLEFLSRLSKALAGCNTLWGADLWLILAVATYSP